MGAVSARDGGTLSYADAVRVWHAALESAGFPDRLDLESISLVDASGRVPAAIARAKHPCPTYRAAAMDGFAVRSADVARASPDTPVDLRVDVEAIAIDTGGALPDGFDSVIPIERVTVDGASIVVGSPSSPGKHVRLPGDDVPPGVAIGWPGLPLRPLDCAVLAASGCTSVDVVKRPRLAVIPTGDELTTIGAPPKTGTVVDSNSLMIAQEARAIGADVTVFPIVRDDGDAIERAIRAALPSADIVALLAGSSRGRRDRSPDAIAAVGSVDVRGIATRPAKPTVLGHAGAAALVDLPGYPAACHFAFHAYVAPLLRRLGGIADPAPRRARLAQSIDVDPTSDEWRIATLLTAPGSPRAIVAQQDEIGGAMYRLARADARFHLKRDIGSFGRHANVSWTPLRDGDSASRALFVGPYDPLIEEMAALGGFRCSFTADELGSALDEGLADAAGLVVRAGGLDALRRLAGSGRKVLPIGMRSEGSALRTGSRAKTVIDGPIELDPWAGVAAVAAGVSASARCTRYIAERFGVRFQEGQPALYAIVWEDRPGRRFPWGIVLSAALGALEGAGPKLGWKSIGMQADTGL